MKFTICGKVEQVGSAWTVTMMLVKPCGEIFHSESRDFDTESEAYAGMQAAANHTADQLRSLGVECRAVDVH